MSPREHAESEAAALGRYNPMRFPWRRVAWWQSAIFAAGWFLTWLGGLGLVLLGAALGNRFVLFFGAASLLLIGPGLLWLVERTTLGLHAPGQSDVDQSSSPERSRSAEETRKSKPKPRKWR